MFAATHGLKCACVLQISVGEVWQESFVLDTILYEAMQPCHSDCEK